MPKYFFRFILEPKKKINPAELFEAIASAEEKVTKKLDELSNQRYLRFNIDANATIDNSKIIIDITIDLILSPLTELFPKQEKIAEDLAYEFISNISQELGGHTRYFREK